ncbi:hypothetical protein GCM10011375_27910 [Hymenobacter qilianensis]|uniref:Uncharacterized protein n=2 Tax=Hymenobacter qilianensis TaxID=1385715 RepID=A0ACB5PTQ1_9BACT|nr:hypothetical protein [Hymenobacter qilianensis]QNP52841.1 hypothetical protein H9L05_03725 [Hymenobacter qilianensis]GGF71156.1 hypothetical protein GCM10011375_27910 [Hymenobacter qilianensis]
MKIRFTLLAAVGVVVLSSLPAFSQQISPADSGAVATAVEAATLRYAKAIGDNSLLYTGPEYLDYNKPYMKGNQYFGTGKQQIGTVYYHGTAYTKVPLLYDMKLDQVVIQPPTNPLQFRLVDDNVQYFIIDGHTFTRLIQRDSARYSIPTGYYDLLVDGNAKVLAKRTKKILTRRGLYGLEGSYLEEAKFYLQKNNEFHPVTSRQSIVRLLSDKKTALDSYARQHKLKFKKSSQEAAIIELVNYYNSL